MLITNHVLAGTICGLTSRKASHALLTGLASHYALDVIPHWGGVSRREFLKVAKTDGIRGLGVLSIMLATTYKVGGAEASIRVAAGICGACLPDLNKPWTYYTGKPSFYPKFAETFHTKIQQESKDNTWIEISAASIMTTLTGALLAREHLRNSSKVDR